VQATKQALKLPAGERRAAIIKSVRHVFAEKGFHGTTTRELAEAAGVSEALLFKHFPNKQALNSAMQFSCCSEQNSQLARKLAALEPSAKSLVYLVHGIVSHIVAGAAAAEDDQTLHTRMMLRSLSEDGEFARQFVRGGPSRACRKLQECIDAAVAAGEAMDGPVRSALGGWFAQHLAAMIRIHMLPATPVVNYGVSRPKLIEQTVWFILRGMGLKEEAIRKHYNPKASARWTAEESNHA
jgi:AcrR family transcriptional regulator